MGYQKIWDKVLNSGENVLYEFSVGRRYRGIWTFFWAFIALLSLGGDSDSGVGFITVISLSLVFYFGFYLKIANAFAFTNKRVLVHRGWLSTRLISVDYSKITDVHVEERLLGKLLYHTGNISINTAGSPFKEITLENVAEPYEIKKKFDAIKDKRRE